MTLTTPAHHLKTGPALLRSRMHWKVKIKSFAGTDDYKVSVEPIAFGLKAVKIMFVMDEDKGSTDDLEADIETIDGVNSVEVTDVRRAIG